MSKSQFGAMLQGNLGRKYSYMSKLFRNALLDNNVDVVKQVLEYIKDKELYRLFLQNFLEDLYKVIPN